MSTVIAIYILLLVVFLAISSLILRHAVTFSYLSHRFKFLAGLFVIIALTVIGFSIYLLLKMDGSSSHTPYEAPPASTGTTSGSGSLNF